MAERRRLPTEEASGLWHQPQAMLLIADLCFLFAAAAFFWIGFETLRRLPLFPLTTLTVTTAPQRVDPLLLEDVARRRLTGNFFTIDLAAARREFEAIPWVRRAHLARQWPHGLVLELEEHEPVARWRTTGEGSARFVNRQGEVFTASEFPGAEQLPLLSGPRPETAPELLARHRHYGERLATIGKALAETQLSARGAWRLIVADGMIIELGREDARQPLDARLSRFLALAPELERRLGSPRVADLRYAMGFALAGLPAATKPAKPSTVSHKS